MKISVESKGSTDKTEKFLKYMLGGRVFAQLNKYGQDGVQALAANTPKDQGETAAAWKYEIVKDRNSVSVIWSNTHMAGPTPVAVLIQMGHGTRNGGLVIGRDYINPAMRPVFDKMANDIWKAVTKQ